MRFIEIWSYKVRKKFNYTCQNCGTTEGKMCAHHIIPMDYNKPWTQDSDLDVTNGICVCIGCHNIIHHKGRKNSEETRRKMSKSHSGENHHMYGKHLSEETKEKISKSKSGENHPLYGKQHPEETKKKMSESQSGENNGMYGRQHSEETKAKMCHSWKCRKDIKIINERYKYYLEKVGE